MCHDEKINCYASFKKKKKKPKASHKELGVIYFVNAATVLPTYISKNVEFWVWFMLTV